MNFKEQRKSIQERRDSESRRGRYALEDKLHCLEVLKANGYDYQKTSRHTGVTVSTLYQWRNRYGDQIENNTALQVAAKAAQADFREYKIRFLKGHFQDLERVTKKAIIRAEVLLNDSSSLKDVANLLNVIYQYVEKLTAETTPPSQNNSDNSARTQINILNAQPPVVQSEPQQVSIDEPE